MLKKKRIIFIICILVFIPTIYATLFLGALKDPYGNLKQLPVALIKQKSNPLYKELVNSNIFNFREETLQDAQKDLTNGKIYGVIYFEKNFGEKMQNFNKKGESPIVHLITSEGLSYSTSKLITGALTQFVTTVNSKLSYSIISKMDGNNIPKSIGSIIKLDHFDTNPIKNNAEAMAPYIFSLTLFVGGIFVNQFILRIFKKSKNFFSFWKKQYLLPTIISFAQVILLLTINYQHIQKNTNNIFLLSLFLFLVASTFSSIIVAFNKLIPGIGSFVILLLTMLQTSSSGGAYAIKLSSHFFQKIHMFLPMTYSIDGIKKIVSLNNYNLLTEIVCLILFWIAGQFILILAYKKNEKILTIC
ncbi:YhgE/Pip domain-containing protein [Vagococcus vulneris]|nr:YhgE/Pip family protein [Vagococcus vulneris]